MINPSRRLSDDELASVARYVLRPNIERFLDSLSTAEQVEALVSLKQRLADSQVELRAEIRKEDY